MSNSELHSTSNSKELIEHWEAQCNRYVNGFCSSRRCLVRGGYSGEGPVDYAIATCEEHETVELLRSPKTRRKAGCPRCGRSPDEMSAYKYDNGIWHIECDGCNYLGPGAGRLRQAWQLHNEAARATQSVDEGGR